MDTYKQTVRPATPARDPGLRTRWPMACTVLACWGFASGGAEKGDTELGGERRRCVFCRCLIAAAWKEGWPQRSSDAKERKGTKQTKCEDRADCSIRVPFFQTFCLFAYLARSDRISTDIDRTNEPQLQTRRGPTLIRRTHAPKRPTGRIFSPSRSKFHPRPLQRLAPKSKGLIKSVDVPELRPARTWGRAPRPSAARRTLASRHDCNQVLQLARPQSRDKGKRPGGRVPAARDRH